MDKTERLPIRRVESGEIDSVDDVVVIEQDVTLEVDGEPLIQTTCSPGELGEWVIGYLFSEGLIGDPSDVHEIRHVGGRFAVCLALRPNPGPPQPVESDLVVGIDRLLEAAAEIIERARTFTMTGGTHAMAIADRALILTMVEDISRTCALEKAIGEALLGGIAFDRSFALLSSRVPSRMIVKLARCGVPIAAAVSAPTAQAVQLARDLDVCLCGFVRGERLNVYTHGWRLDL